MKFDTLAIASISTHHLLVQDIGDMNRAMAQLIGYDVYTHQMGRVLLEVEPHIQAHLPGFPTDKEAVEYGVSSDTVEAYCNQLLETWGPTVELPPMMEVQPQVDPVLELQQKFGGKVIPVRLG